MKKRFLLLLVSSICLLLSGCHTMAGKNLLGNAMGEAANAQVGYGKQCFSVQSQCVQGQYEEWETSDGVQGCSCKKL